jgi:hypothetical protein
MGDQHGVAFSGEQDSSLLTTTETIRRKLKQDGLGRIIEKDSNQSGGKEEADGWHPAARFGVAELPRKAALG